MVTDVSGNAEAFELANSADPLVKSASVAELVALTGSAFQAESQKVLPAKHASTPTPAAIFTNNPNPVRTVALNVMRFAFVLIGIGLLLRVGAAEQAVSAIEEERLQVQRPLTTKLVPPQRAFAYEMKDQTKTGSGPMLADPVRHGLRQGTFTAERNASFADMAFVRESAAGQQNLNARNDATKSGSSAAMPAPMMPAPITAGRFRAGGSTVGCPSAGPLPAARPLDRSSRPLSRRLRSPRRKTRMSCRDTSDFASLAKAAASIRPASSAVVAAPARMVSRMANGAG